MLSWIINKQKIKNWKQTVGIRLTFICKYAVKYREEDRFIFVWMCFYRWNLHETVIINERTTVTLQVYIWGSWMQASTQLVIFFVWTISKLLKFTDRRTPVKANNKTTRFVFVSFVNINRIPSQDWFWVGTFGILYTGLFFLLLVFFVSFLLRLQTILPVLNSPKCTY